MKRLVLTSTDEQIAELKKHLERNGYSVKWEEDNNILYVDDEEFSYITTILLDRCIPFQVKKLAIHEFALMEMIGLIEKGFHYVYGEDCGDYFTVFLTNDNGNMKEKDIIDRYFDFDYV